jgi:hypothetical protein
LIQLYAHSCFQNGDKVSAFVSANRVLNEYSKWRHIEEPYFLLGQIAYKNRTIKLAGQYWVNLSPKFETSLISFINKNPFSYSKDSINNLRNDSAFKETMFLKVLSQQTQIASGNKNNKALRLGIVLPFDLHSKINTIEDNPIFDFYRGISLAFEVLAASDSAIEMYTFDFKNSIKELNLLIKNQSFSGLNLILGPIKFTMLPQMETLSNELKTPIINPLSYQNFDSPNSYLHAQQPSFSTISSAAFEFVSKLTIGRKAGIIFGPEKNDSLLADSYKKVLLKMGRELVLFKKVGKNSAANLTKFLVESGLDSTSHLFIANNEALVRLQLPGAYSWTKAKYPVVVFGKWIESPTADFGEYKRLPFYFIGSDLPDYEHSQFKNWKESYILKWGLPPNWIAWKGFDLVFSFTKKWYNSNNSVFSKEDLLNPIKSELFGTYQFSKLELDNQYVPIYKVEDHFFQKVWPE